MNGHPTPSLSGFHLEFARGGFSGEIGCNLVRGNYSIQGNVMRPGLVMKTERACSANPPTLIPLMTYEDWASRVLGRPMRLSWSSSRSVTLSNEAGSVTLELMR